MNEKAALDYRDMLAAWSRRAKRAAVAHYESARRLEKRHYSLGVALVFASAATTSLAGRTLFEISGQLLDESMTIVSVLTLGLACVQVFLGDSERAARFKLAGARFAALKREIEHVQVELRLQSVDGNAAKKVSDIRERLDRLAEDAPSISSRVWLKIANKFGEDELDARLHHLMSHEKVSILK